MKNYNNWNEVPAAEIIDLIDSIDSHGVYKEAFFTERGISAEMAGVHYIKAGTGKHALYANVDGEVVSVDGMTGITGFEIAFNICQALGVSTNYSDARGRGRILEANANALREHFGATAAS